MGTVVSSIRYLLRFTEDERTGAQYRERLHGPGSAAGAPTVAAVPAAADTSRNRRLVASADGNATAPFTHRVPAAAFIPAPRGALDGANPRLVGLEVDSCYLPALQLERLVVGRFLLPIASPTDIAFSVREVAFE
jgi:hypothetical protein